MSFRTEMLRFISQFTGTMSSTGNYRVKINHSKKVSDISCLGGCRPDYCQVSNKNFGTKLTSFMSNAVFLKPSCFFNIISWQEKECLFCLSSDSPESCSRMVPKEPVPWASLAWTRELLKHIAWSREWPFLGSRLYHVKRKNNLPG